MSHYNGITWFGRLRRNLCKILGHSWSEPFDGYQWCRHCGGEQKVNAPQEAE